MRDQCGECQANTSLESHTFVGNLDYQHMVDTNWVDRPGTKHPTCSCGLVNVLVNVVVVDVQHNAALTIVTGGVQGGATTSNAHLLVALFSFIVGFVLLLLSRPSMLSLSTLSMSESLMPLCGLAHAFLASSPIIFSPLPTAHLMNVPALLLLVFLHFL